MASPSITDWITSGLLLLPPLQRLLLPIKQNGQRMKRQKLLKQQVSSGIAAAPANCYRRVLALVFGQSREHGGHRPES